MKRFWMLSLILVLSLIIAACGVPAAPEAPVAEQATEPAPTTEPEAEAADVVDTAIAAGSFNTLVAAVQAAGLEEALRGEGPFTVFAPTDDAFAALPEGTLDSLLADPEALGDILLYHVVSGEVMAADVADGMTAETLQGAPVSFTVADGAVQINDANITATDVEASNGVIHVIDAVILPPSEEEAMGEEEASAEADIVDTAIAAGNFNTLVAAVQAAGLEEALRGEGPFTVFAPTDEAFAALPEGTVDSLLADPKALGDILLYHVISGKVMAADVSDGLTAETVLGAPVTFSIADGAAMINDANIVATDVEASNGVIHVIDAVILPPTDEEAMAEADIVDTAIAAGSFNTLVTAVQAAGLEEALRGEGPFTVFAPTDDAFAALPEGTLDSLLADPEALGDILLYHVLSGKVMAADVTDGLTAETLLGAPVSFSIMDGAAMINDANIVATDVEATNGVIHVIDAVILPPAEEEAMGEEEATADADIVDTAIAAGNFNTLVAAVQAAGLEEALRGEGPFTVFAPTDEAFAALPEGTLDSLLADPEALADILLYHVAEGTLLAKDVAARGFIPTLLGRNLTASVMGDEVTINDANVIAIDILASNGVIHVIDAVLVPATGGGSH